MAYGENNKIPYVLIEEHTINGARTVRAVRVHNQESESAKLNTQTDGLLIEKKSLAQKIGTQICAFLKFSQGRKPFF